MNKSMIRFIGASNAVRLLLAPLLLGLAAPPAAAQNFWQQTNGPVGGDIRALAVHPVTREIFAGTSGGGVFRSMNNGDSWEPANMGLANEHVRGLAVKNSNGHIFAGTFGGGVFRATNSSAGWEPINAGLTNGDILALAINESNGDIFSGTGKAFFFDAEDNSIFRSTDNGQNWTSVKDLAKTIVYALAINAASRRVFAGTSRGVYRSEDNGNSWTQLQNELTNLAVHTLAINLNGEIFAGAGAAGRAGEVFRSTDNGQNWTRVYVYPNLAVSSALTINSAGHIFAGAAGFLELPGGGIFRSTNNGDSWEQPPNSGLTNAGVRALVSNANDHIFAGTRDGVYRSLNNGGNWLPGNAGLTATLVSAFAFETNGRILAGTEGSGVFRLSADGKVWAPFNEGLMNPLVHALAGKPEGDIFVGTYGGGVFRFAPNANKWASTGLTNLVVRSLAINNDGEIFAGTVGVLNGRGRGVFRSKDNGAAWASLKTGLQDTTVRALAIKTNGEIFAGTAGGVYRSTNNGANWEAANNGLTNRNIRALAIADSGHIFAAAGIFLATLRGGVFRSGNNGGNWMQVDQGFTSTEVQALARNAAGHIFAGTANGVFRSTDRGDYWMPVNTGLTSTGVRAFAFDSLGYILAGTEGGGVFRSVASTFAPIATTNIATNVGSAAATLNGVVNASGLTTTVKFEYGATTSYGNLVTATPSSLTGVDDVSVSAAIAGLALGTTYHFRVVAINSAGTVNGADRIFVTSPVPNLAPMVVNIISDQMLTVGGARFTRNLNASPVVFRDPDGDTLAYAASSNATAIATASLSSSLLTVAPLTTGKAMITVTATDAKSGTTSTRFTVTVNRPPAVRNAIDRQTLMLGDSSYSRDLNLVFRDPDGDPLTYAASSSAPSIAPASLSGSMLAVAPVAAGSATITVTANDGRGGTASIMFAVMVNRAPNIINTIPDQNLTVGGISFTRHLNASPVVFNDPDGDALSYHAFSSAPTTALPSIAGNTLTVKPIFAGNAKITVTARDNKHKRGAASTSFMVAVTGRPQTNVNVTAEIDTVLASSVFSGDFALWGPKLGVDGKRITSWFSAGNKTDSDSSVYRWTGRRDHQITAVAILSNAEHPIFPTGFGFQSVRVRVLDRGDATVSDDSFDLSGTPDPDVVALPNVMGRSVVLILRGHEHELCGGFSELQILALNESPAAPAPLAPSANAFIKDNSPDLRFSVPTDPNGTSLHFRVEIDDDGNFGAGTQTYESKSNVSGFNPTPPVPQGSVPVAYTVQSALADGDWWWRVSAWDGLVYGDASAARRFIVDTSAPRIDAAAVDSAFFNQERAITATLSDNLGIQSATLFYRQGGASAFTPAIMRPISGAIYRSAISGNLINARGLEYYIAVDDSANNQRTFPETNPSVRPQVIRVAANSFSFPFANPTPAKAYRMISAPFDLKQKSPAQVFADDLGSYDDTKWRLLRYRNGVNLEFGAATFDSLTPGTAFWLITKDPASLDAGAGKSVTTGENFKITLPPGWSQIGNPFAFVVNWHEVIKSGNVENQLVGYQGSSNDKSGYDHTRTQLIPGEGYFVHNLENSPAIIEIPAKAANGEPAAKIADWKPALRSNEWMLQITATCDRYLDKDNYIGYLDEAADQWDANDFSEAPFFDQHVSLYFPHLEWPRYPGLYTGDFRAIKSEGDFWDFQVKSEVIKSEVGRSEAVVTLAEAKNLPEDWQIRLLDKTSRFAIDFHAQKRYAFLYGANESAREFRLVVGKQDFVEANDLDLAGVPADFVLEQNFPNPFNPETSIRFGLPQSSVVTIKIFDLAGHEVATLLDRVELSAGRHQRVWDGRDSQGRAVVSGIYFYQLIAGSFSRTMKLMLVR